MALPLVIAQTVQVRLIWLINGQLGINVLHARSAGVPAVTQALANTLGAAIKSAYTANLAPLQSTNAALTKVGVRSIHAPNQPEFLDVGTGVGGSAVGDSLPANVALCVTLRTALAGKSFRGRVYVGGWAESVNANNGAADAASTSAAVAFMTAVSNALTASALTLAVASRPAERYTLVLTTFHNDGTSTADVLSKGDARSGTSTPVTSIAALDSRWDSQRRRNNGRGVPITLVQGPVAQTFLNP